MEANELRKLINEVGGEIQDKLEPLPYRRNRNSYAHIYGMIREITGTTYSEAEEGIIVSILEIIRQSPNISIDDMKSRLK